MKIHKRYFNTVIGPTKGFVNIYRDDIAPTVSVLLIVTIIAYSATKCKRGMFKEFPIYREIVEEGAIVP